MAKSLSLALLTLLLALPLTTLALSSPTISSVSRSSTGSVLYTVSGKGFVKGAKLTLGGVAPLASWQGGSTFIVFQPPKGKRGTVDVKVVNPDGGSVVKKGGFTYPTTVAAPVVKGVAPAAGSNVMKAVWGSNFESGATVYVNNVLALSQRQVGTQYIVFAPPSGVSGSVTVEVRNPSGGKGSVVATVNGTGGGTYGYQTPVEYTYQTPAYAYQTPGGGNPGPVYYNHPFPRKGGYLIGGDQGLHSASDRDWAATLNFAILNGYFQGQYPNNNGQTRQQVYADIKERSAAKGTNVRIAQYVNYNEAMLFDGFLFPSMDRTITSNNWWIYEHGTNGTKVFSAWDYPRFGLINQSHFVPKININGAGLYPNEYFAWLTDQILQKGAEGQAHVAPAIDYYYIDNIFWYLNPGKNSSYDLTRVNGSWSQDDFRLGESDFMNYGKNVVDPSRGWGGNTPNPYYPEAADGGLSNLTHLENIHDVGLMEFALGKNSGEFYEGTDKWLKRYKWLYDHVMRTTDSPAVIQADFLDARGRDTESTTDFQGARYAQGLTAMGQGYFFDTAGYPTFYGTNSIRDFDEMVGGSLNQRGWLGYPEDGQQDSVWQGSVYRRRYTNGAVFVNQRHAQPQVIDLTGYKRLTGSQNSSVNNGQVGGTYMLPPGDALFVIKANAQAYATPSATPYAYQTPTAYSYQTPTSYAYQTPTSSGGLRVLIVSGGGYHNYPLQRQILEQGLRDRVGDIHITHAYRDPTNPIDMTTDLPINSNPNYGDGFDVIIHDECVSAQDATEMANVLAPHDRGIPGVNIHCALHSYGGNSSWLSYLGIHSSTHGPQAPIALRSVSNSPIMSGLQMWTTGNEELYNNIATFNSTPLIAGTQNDTDFAVAWTHYYGNTRVFTTSLAHNESTMQDSRYLDLLARGVLWAAGRI